jgi:WD40 repeat protein
MIMLQRWLLPGLLCVVGVTSATAQSEPKPAGEKPKAAVDLYGDPLPPGAVARLGTVRFRLKERSFRGDLAFLPDNKTILNSDWKTLQFWDAASGRLLRELPTEPAWVDHLRLAPDGRHLAFVAFGNKVARQVRILDVATGKLVCGFNRPEGVSLMAFAPDGKLLFSVSETGIFRIEDVASGEERVQIKLPPAKEVGRKDLEPRGRAIAPDGKILAFTSGFDLYVWKWADEEPRVLHRMEHVFGVAFSPDGKQLAALYGHPARVRVWDIATGKLVQERELAGAKLEGAGRLLFTPNGKMLLADLYDGRGHHRVEILDAKSLRGVGSLQLDRVDAMTVSSDSRRLALATGPAVRIWDLTTLKEVTPNNQAHTGAVTCVRVSPNGLVVTAGEDRTVRLWDGARGEHRGVYRFDDAVVDVAFSRDGAQFATSGRDDTVRLFAADSGAEILRLRGHGRSGENRALLFLPDGRSLLSWGSDFYVRRWNLTTGNALSEQRLRPKGIDLPDNDKGPGDDRTLISMRYSTAAMSADGKTVLADLFGDFRSFDTSTGNETAQLMNLGFIMGAVAISPDRRYVLISAYGRSLQEHQVVFRELAGPELMTITLPEKHPSAVAFSADSRSFAVSAAGEIRIYEISTRQIRRVFRGFRGVVQSLAFFPDGRCLASGLSDSTVLIWDLTAGGTTGGPPVTTEI